MCDLRLRGTKAATAEEGPSAAMDEVAMRAGSVVRRVAVDEGAVMVDAPGAVVASVAVVAVVVASNQSDQRAMPQARL